MCIVHFNSQSIKIPRYLTLSTLTILLSFILQFNLMAHANQGLSTNLLCEFGPICLVPISKLTVLVQYNFILIQFIQEYNLCNLIFKIFFNIYKGLYLNNILWCHLHKGEIKSKQEGILLINIRNCMGPRIDP